MAFKADAIIPDEGTPYSGLGFTAKALVTLTPWLDLDETWESDYDHAEEDEIPTTLGIGLASEGFHRTASAGARRFAGGGNRSTGGLQDLAAWCVPSPPTIGFDVNVVIDTWDSYGFTFSDANNTRPSAIHMLAFGGDHVNAKAGELVVPDTGGTVTLSGLPFDPTQGVSLLLLIFGGGSSGGGGPAWLSLGAAVSDVKQWCCSCRHEDLLASPSAVLGFHADQCMSKAGNVDLELAFSNWESDGFTLDILTNPGSDTTIAYLVINSTHPDAYIDVGEVTGDITGLSGEPEGLIVAMQGDEEVGGLSAACLSVGALDVAADRQQYASYMHHRNHAGSGSEHMRAQEIDVGYVGFLYEHDASTLSSAAVSSVSDTQVELSLFGTTNGGYIVFLLDPFSRGALPLLGVG